jgi:formate-dependent nitrite reductase membrane component NrfD
VTVFELTTTRANPLVDPGFHAWGWEIPVYLFLGGLVAGMMIIAGYFLFSGRHQNRQSASLLYPGLSALLLSAGMLALLLDLARKVNVWRLYTTFEVTSPMSWGAWILVLVYPALAANLLLRPPTFALARWPRLGVLARRLLRHQHFVKWVGALNMIFGALLGVYTGILLSSLAARPLWNSALLGPLFLVSGMSSAAALVHMIAPIAEERELLAKADNGFLVAELIVLALFLIGLATSGRASREAVALLLGGPLTAVFWVFVVAAGIIIPLVVQLLAVNHRIRHTPVAPILVLAGGVLLRFVFVYGGQLSHWGSL